jgi:hypothetical protein
MADYVQAVRFNQNQLLHPVIHNAASAPLTPVNGQIYYNTAVQTMYYWAVDHWVSVTQTTSGAGAFQATIGDGQNTTYTVTHNLGTVLISVQLYTTATPHTLLEADVSVSNINHVTLSFGHPVATDSIQVLVFAEAPLPGPRGSRIYTGTGLPNEVPPTSWEPDGSDAAAGDLYIDISGPEFYMLG